jgi:hypothetical protein
MVCVGGVGVRKVECCHFLKNTSAVNMAYYCYNSYPYPGQQQNFYQQQYYNGSCFPDLQFSAGLNPQYPTAASSSANLLTPTTFASLERTLDLAISNDSSQHQAAESGFVPPVVNPIVIDPAAMGVKREYDASWDDGSSCSSTDPEWNPSSKRRRTDAKSIVPHIDPNTYLMPNSRRPTGPRKERKDEVVSVSATYT